MAKIEKGSRSVAGPPLPPVSWKPTTVAWQTTLKRAREGSGEPFKVVGWDGKVSEHSVSKGVLDAAGTGARGSHVRRTLEAAPYGWPQGRG